MKGKVHIYSLDFLRVLATALIILHHYEQLTCTYWPEHLNFYGGKFYFGTVVEFFFVLSGYVIERYSEPILEGVLSVSDFIKKRVIRLLPILGLSVIVYEFLSYICSYTEETIWLFDTTINIWGSIITSLGLSVGGVFGNPSINNPTWYVSVLLICYWAFGIILNTCKKNKVNKMYAYIIMIVVGLGVANYQINLPFLNSYSARGYMSFFTGCILNNISKNKKLSLYEMLAEMLVVFASLYMIAYRFEWCYSLNYILTFIVYPCLIRLFADGKIFRKIFDKKLWGVIGDSTYDVFIWHCPLILLFIILNERKLVMIDFNNRIIMWSFMCICFVIGGLFYYIIDKPITHLLKMKFEKMGKDTTQCR